MPYHFNVPKKSCFTQEWLLISLKFLLFFLQNSLLVIVSLIKMIVTHFDHNFQFDEEHHIHFEHHDFDEEHDGVKVSK